MERSLLTCTEGAVTPQPSTNAGATNAGTRATRKPMWPANRGLSRVRSGRQPARRLRAVQGDDVTVAVRIHAKITGQRRDALGDHALDLQLPAGPVTLAELVTSVVRAEAATFDRRAEERTLIRVLTPQALAAELATGRVLSGGADPSTPLNVDEAVDTALLAYTDGLFKVFVNDIEIEALDITIDLTGTPTVLFLRLVPLAGG